MITPQEKEAVFSEELARIYDRKIREFTRLCITQAPDYVFEDCPSSTSGKFHPIDELGPDGTIIHTKKVFTIAYELVKALECENNRDLVLSACIIHDLCKQGTDKSGHTIKDHALYAARLIDEVQGATMLLTEKQHSIIRNSVAFHYGPWTDEADGRKPIADYTPEELAVFLSDFVVSKRFIRTDYRR